MWMQTATYKYNTTFISISKNKNIFGFTEKSENITFYDW